MDATVLIAIYLVTAMIIQGIGFGISEAVNYEFPTAGLLTFLALFLAAFWVAWPITVRIFERLWGDRPRRGETEQQRAARHSGIKVDYQHELDKPLTKSTRSGKIGGAVELISHFGPCEKCACLA